MRILVNRSDGTHEDIVEIVRIVANATEPGTVRVYDDGAATAIARFEGELDTEIAIFLIRMLRKAKPGAVRIILESWPAVEDSMFSFEPFPGETGTGLGFGSTADSSVGGVLASAMD